MQAYYFTQLFTGSQRRKRNSILSNSPSDSSPLAIDCSVKPANMISFISDSVRALAKKVSSPSCAQQT